MTPRLQNPRSPSGRFSRSLASLPRGLGRARINQAASSLRTLCRYGYRALPYAEPAYSGCTPSPSDVLKELIDGVFLGSHPPYSFSFGARERGEGLKRPSTSREGLLGTVAKRKGGCLRSQGHGRRIFAPSSPECDTLNERCSDPPMNLRPFELDHAVIVQSENSLDCPRRDLRIRENVEAFERQRSEHWQDLNNVVGRAALGHQLRALQ